MFEDIKKIFQSRSRILIGAIAIAVYVVIFLIFRFYGIDRDNLNPVLNRFGDHNFTAIYVLQLIFSLTPIPDSIIAYIAVIILDVYQTFLAIYLGMLTASMIHFWIARRYGPGFVTRFFPKMGKQINDFHGKVDTHHLIIYRLFALVSFDVVAYVAGFSGVKFKNFFIATALGLPPMIIPNILLAYGLLEKNLLNTLLLWGGAGFMMLLIAYIVKKFY